MNKKEYKITKFIFRANNDFSEKIKIMREKYHLNISAVIRDLLEKKFEELENKNSK